MSFTAHDSAATAIVLMVGMTAFMDWVPTPLNRNIQAMSVRERLPSTIIHSSLGLGFAIANGLSLKWAILVGAFWFSVVLLAAVRNWWIAYFFGVHRGEITPEIYLRHYAQNVTVLLRFNQNPVIPDLQHMLIHFAVVATVLLSWYSFWLA